MSRKLTSAEIERANRLLALTGGKNAATSKHVRAPIESLNAGKSELGLVTGESGCVRQKSTGRGRFDLIPPFAMERLAKLYEWGAENRGDRNWEKGCPFSRCIESMERHICKLKQRTPDEDHDDNLAAIAFWAIAMMEYEEMMKRGILPQSLDDMPHYDHVAKVSTAIVPSYVKNIRDCYCDMDSDYICTDCRGADLECGDAITSMDSNAAPLRLHEPRYLEQNKPIKEKSNYDTDIVVSASGQLSDAILASVSECCVCSKGCPPCEFCKTEFDNVPKCARCGSLEIDYFLPRVLKVNTINADKRMRIYVCGPITNKSDPDQQNRNFVTGRIVSKALEDKGHLMFSPFRYESDCTPEQYGTLMQLDLSIIREWATALYFIGHSRGADRELALAEELGLTIIHDIDEVPDLSERSS